MTVDAIREFCLTLRGSNENIQWGNNLVFKVGPKIFAILDLGGRSAAKLSFKCRPEEFAEMIEQQGVLPAPYLARAKWIALQELNALPSNELKCRLRDSYELVVAGLPGKLKRQLVAQRTSPSKDAVDKAPVR